MNKVTLTLFIIVQLQFLLVGAVLSSLNNKDKELQIRVCELEIPNTNPSCTIPHTIAL